MEKNWFAVDKDGLAELQSGKPKFYAVRELISNAFDEDISICEVKTAFENGLATISVYDDSEKGFRHIEDAYTLFRHTYKRAEPTKRGRFNTGEKFCFAICEKATLETTKGTVSFVNKGRHYNKFKKTEKGSKITIELKMIKKEYTEIEDKLKSFLVPKRIVYKVNGTELNYKKPYKTITAILSTELEKEDGAFRKTQRKTQIFLHKSNEKSILYELGVPVCEIECQFSIDVGQKIPLSVDRETVSQAFLQDLYSEVLNNTFEEITEKNASAVWVRTATSDERIQKEAVSAVLTKRFGEKFCSANPFDKNSIDEAISSGYKTISGSEMSGKEWSAVKGFGLISSSSDLFGKVMVGAETILDLTSEQEVVKNLSKKIAKRLLGINLTVVFVKSKADTRADFGNNVLTYNVSRLGKTFFDPPVSDKTLNLLIHELGHAKGNHHTEMAYHQLLTELGSKLAMLALTEPSFFKEFQKLCL